ncbi:diguanylate cyclase [Methyloterricola oryzae]|uniref:diguanylate cyclase n=1 Tax=Methyloterricola oryzae TaxID=1495050 RepID=UPI0005EBA777|nr:diguanylate cyclase [Methyloterricola oryzae]
MVKGHRFQEIKASGKLPSPAGLALEIMRLCQSPTASVQELTAKVRLDPALSGRLLKLVNSAHHAMRRPVVAVGDAVQLLGMQTVRQFALTLSVVSANRRGACQAFDYEGFWTSALARALAAQALAVLDGGTIPEEAFTCAILSRIGQLALASVYPQEYGECLRTADTRESLLQAEQTAFAIDHQQITVELLRDWGFPPVLVDAVAREHEGADPCIAAPGRVERLAAQLRLADSLAHSLIESDQERETQIASLLALAIPLALDGNDLEGIYAAVEEQWSGYCQLFQITSKDRGNPGAPRPEACGPSPEPQAAPGPKILLIQSDPAELARLERFIASQGYHVITAASGQEGLRHFLESFPRLAIIGHVEGRLDGIRFCENLRSLEIGREIYLMILASVQTEDAQVRAYAAGVNDFVIRPVNDRVLLARIECGMRMIQLQDENEREKEKVRRQVSKLAIAKRKLEVMAMTDPLTGIPNRRYAFSRLREEWAAWQRKERPLSVMILDLDHFKGINDNYGHQAGDRLLSHVAEIIRVNLRGADVVCRLGGEEFIVIAPGADEDVAHALAERLREAIESNPMDGDDVAKPITASIGVATAGTRVANPSDLVHLADLALYEAKLDGRNRTRLNGYPHYERLQ